MAIEKDPCGILAESRIDPDGGYVHKCGRYVIGKVVSLSVVGLGPNGAGTGEVVEVIQPCCPPCGIEPNAHGTIDYLKTPSADEKRIIDNMGKNI